MKRREFRETVEKELVYLAKLLNPAIPIHSKNKYRSRDLEDKIELVTEYAQNLAHTRRIIIPANDYTQPKGMRSENKRVYKGLYKLARMLGIERDDITLTKEYESALNLIQSIRTAITYWMFELYAERLDEDLRAKGKINERPNN